jgi:ADP-heptose:LPS heptosyltransferase/predicted SAM-dependent methyltransferase
MVWNIKIDSTGQELAKIYPLIVPYTRGKGIDIGSGQARWFGHWMTLDSGKDYQGKRVADFHVDGSQPLPMFADGCMDFVISSHFVEHCADWAAAVREWWRLVKPGGYLTLYWPHPDLYPRVGQPGSNPDHKADIWPHAMVQVFRRLGGWNLIENETRNGGEEYSQFQVWQKRDDALQNVVPWTRKEKSLLLIRYGAFGDLIQASSVAAGLKAEGWHVTLNTTPRGMSTVEHDPNIDAFIIQDEGQVPNEALGPYWDEMGKRYDRTVNLCEGVEATLLTLPGSLHDKHSDAVRRKLYGKNYLERQHDIAGLPHVFKPAFYPTDEEVARVDGILADLPGPVVLWILGGSSPHKIWPHTPPAIVRMLYRHPTATVILAGEAKHKDLEVQVQDSAKLFFGSAQRIIRTAGEWPIRGTMALAQRVDLVVGPETGVLNAVSHIESVAKVVFLSHSSEENLTKHWPNTRVLKPVEGSTPCHPCHRLHFNFDRCHQDKVTGAALCQANITVEQAVDALLASLSEVGADGEAVDVPPMRNLIVDHPIAAE